MRQGILTIAAWAATTGAFAPLVSACPVCDTDTGAQVRSAIMDGDFGGTLAAVLLPFPILLGVVAAIHFGWPRRPRTGGGAGRTGDANGRTTDGE